MDEACMAAWFMHAMNAFGVRWVASKSTEVTPTATRPRARSCISRVRGHLSVCVVHGETLQHHEVAPYLWARLLIFGHGTWG